jgi:hypothetical protein
VGSFHVFDLKSIRLILFITKNDNLYKKRPLLGKFFKLKFLKNGKVIRKRKSESETEQPQLRP